ncbi:unnamed protein product [Clonostachys rosea]|uniref:Methyltransferase-domain-containing protein n=1 Tax=Bionectria ochroleuca TaxID=29856 RepID=A0ABY6UN45_BIOOC|nr:unnamed protein product [Clonostachys rosea]
MSTSHRSYEIQKNETEKVSIKIAEARVEAENLPLTTWASSFVLSDTLYSLKIDATKLQKGSQGEYSILELGAGTGLTGLSAAAIWGGNTLLTELPGIVPGLQMNIDLNKDMLSAGNIKASCGALDWNSPEVVHISQPNGTTESMSTKDGFSIILAADTMYTEDHPELLSDTIARCLRRAPHARAIICHPLRVAYIDHIREFWEKMELLGLVADEEGRKELDLTNWDDERLQEWSSWKWKTL